MSDVEYRDSTPLNPNADLPELIEGIKHKKKGKDVRLAIALSLQKVYGGQAGVKPAELQAKLDQLSKTNKNQLAETKTELDDKINRITLGIDPDLIEKIVTKILKDKGVI